MSDLTKHIAQLSKIARDHENAKREISQFTSDDLTAQGIANERARRMEKVNADTAQAVAQARAAAENELSVIKSRAESSALPKPNGSTADEWARIQMLLEAGKSMHQVISGATIEQLQAIREWGPTYQEAQTFKTIGGPNALGEELSRRAGGPASGSYYDPAPLMNSIASRWAELSPKDALFVREQLEAAGEIAQFEYTASSLEVVATGVNVGSPMAIAIAAQDAGQRGAAQFLG